MLLAGFVTGVVLGRGRRDEVADARSAGIGVHGTSIRAPRIGRDNDGRLEGCVGRRVGGGAVVSEHLELRRGGNGGRGRVGGGGMELRIILVMDCHGRAVDLGVDQ